MRLFRSTIGSTAIAVAALSAQPTDQTRKQEAALKSSLLTLRNAIDRYSFDQHKLPRTLQDLIVKGYVKSIPTDPMTGSNLTWRVVMEDSAKSANRDEPGIFDVRSGSDAVSPDGTRYANW